jgi:hypothetical protein
MKEEFMKELKALLEKYNVCISATVGKGSDTHGIYDEQIVVYHQIGDSFKTEDWLIVDGWSLDKNDIE